jgi:hypothetical protein
MDENESGSQSKVTADMARAANLKRFLKHEAWLQIPQEILGKPITRAEREAILDSHAGSDAA